MNHLAAAMMRHVDSFIVTIHAPGHTFRATGPGAGVSRRPR